MRAASSSQPLTRAPSGSTPNHQPENFWPIVAHGDTAHGSSSWCLQFAGAVSPGAGWGKCANTWRRGGIPGRTATQPSAAAPAVDMAAPSSSAGLRRFRSPPAAQGGPATPSTALCAPCSPVPRSGQLSVKQLHEKVFGWCAVGTGAGQEGHFPTTGGWRCSEYCRSPTCVPTSCRQVDRRVLASASRQGYANPCLAMW